MTDPVLQLESSVLAVEPGGQISTKVTVRNTGTIVEGFALQVLGEEVSAWAQVTPAEVQIYPEQEASAIVIFAPPVGGSRSGSFPFGVRAESVVDPNSAAVIEGDVEVGRVFGLQATMSPVTSTGRWRGKHVVTLTNWGNSPVRLKVAAADPDERLAFFVHPEIVELPIGVGATVGIQVRTLAPFLRGTQVRLPFQVKAEPDPPESEPAGPISMVPSPRQASVDGAFMQRPILSRFVVVLATLLVLGIAAGLYFALSGTRKSPTGDLAVGAPLTPALSATAVDSSTAQLNWEGQQNLESYKVLTLTADGKTSGVTSIDGALDTFQVSELTPGSQVCFQLQAVRGELESLLSEIACVQIPVAPASPISTEVSASSTPGMTEPAVASGIPTAVATAEPVPSSLASPPPTGAAGEEGQPPGGTVVVPPGGGAQGGEVTATVTVPGSNAGGSTVPGSEISLPAGGFAATQYIDVVWSSPVTDAQAAQRAEAKKLELIAAGIAAQVLDSTNYPDLELFEGAGPLVNPSYLVFVGPFENRAEAEALCASRSELSGYCLPSRPNPNG